MKDPILTLTFTISENDGTTKEEQVELSKAELDLVIGEMEKVDRCTLKLMDSQGK